MFCSDMPARLTNARFVAEKSSVVWNASELPALLNCSLGARDVQPSIHCWSNLTRIKSCSANLNSSPAYAISHPLFPPHFSPSAPLPLLFLSSSPPHRTYPTSQTPHAPTAAKQTPPSKVHGMNHSIHPKNTTPLSPPSSLTHSLTHSLLIIPTCNSHLHIEPP